MRRYYYLAASIRISLEEDYNLITLLDINVIIAYNNLYH